MYARYLFAALLVAALTTPALAEQTITVDFSQAHLTVQRDDRVRVETPVVLPRRSYYPVPVSGTVTRAVMGPIWIPTANMHRDQPGRYKARYGPYEPGNAMGHCKLYIDFDIDLPLLKTVRIHGNAKTSDLGTRKSRSCIRIPDAVCPDLVNAVQRYSGTTRVHFVR